MQLPAPTLHVRQSSSSSSSPSSPTPTSRVKLSELALARAIDRFHIFSLSLFKAIRDSAAAAEHAAAAISLAEKATRALGNGAVADCTGQRAQLRWQLRLMWGDAVCLVAKSTAAQHADVDVNVKGADGAVDAFRTAIARLEKQHFRGSQKHIGILIALSAALSTAGAEAEAQGVARAAVDLAVEGFTSASVAAGKAYRCLARALRPSGRWPEVYWVLEQELACALRHGPCRPLLDRDHHVFVIFFCFACHVPFCTNPHSAAHWPCTRSSSTLRGGLFGCWGAVGPPQAWSGRWDSTTWCSPRRWSRWRGCSSTAPRWTGIAASGTLPARRRCCKPGYS